MYLERMRQQSYIGYDSLAEFRLCQDHIEARLREGDVESLCYQVRGRDEPLPVPPARARALRYACATCKNDVSYDDVSSARSDLFQQLLGILSVSDFVVGVQSFTHDRRFTRHLWRIVVHLLQLLAILDQLCAFGQ